MRRIQVRTSRMVSGVMAGSYSSVFRGSGIEFDEVREYCEGDDIRSVDWNVTARTGKPFIKKYVEERELTVLFLLDLSGSTDFGTVLRKPGAKVRSVRETAAEFCACMSLAAARNNDKAGLIGFSDRIERYVPAKKGNQHVLRLIREALSLRGAGQGSDISAALDYAARVQRKRAVIFLISDFFASGYDKAMRRLAGRHDLIAVRIHDPHTRELPNAGLLHLRDMETGAAIWVDSGSRRVRAAYAEKMRSWEQDYRNLCRRSRVDSMEIHPERSIADPILRFFRMRELRGSHG